MVTFRKLFGKTLPPRCNNAAARRRQPRLEVQQLEDRLVPAMLTVTSPLAPAAVTVPNPAVLGYVQTNLVSNNIAGQARITDPNLVDPWGINFPQLPGINPPVVVADQGTGVATSYQISPNGLQVSEASLPVKIPTVGSSKPSGPTGVVQNTDSNDFLIPGPDGTVPATYIFDTLQGTIEGYAADNTGAINAAQIMVNNSSTGAQYTGLAAGTITDAAGNVHDYIYAANEGTTPGIQVFDTSFNQVQLPNVIGWPGNPNFTGNFTLPAGTLPAGFMPYGVRDLSLDFGSKQDADLFVTYRGPSLQGGAVAVFTNGGTYLGLIDSDATGGNLQSPWGLAYIKQGLFGEFGGDLLVGNFSSGRIDAYNVTLSNTEASGQFLGQLPSAYGTPLTIPGLRTIHFGPGLGGYGSYGSAQGFGPHVGLLFTAETAITNNPISLYGEITPAAEPIPTVAPKVAKAAYLSIPGAMVNPAAVSGSEAGVSQSVLPDASQIGTDRLAVLDTMFATLASQPEAYLTPEKVFGVNDGLQSLDGLLPGFGDLEDMLLAALGASFWPAS